MADPFPSHLTVEIDRSRLRRYLRAKWLVSWVILCGVFGLMFGPISVGDRFDQGMFSWRDVLIIVASRAGLGLLLGVLVGVLFYFALSHWLAARFARELAVSVEGPFLRICQRLVVANDRKLHFRSIVDYAVVEDPFMRGFGIRALQMTTTGSGPTATITVPGVLDCHSARDLLAEIDRVREHAA
jgi:hypothetical protein